MPLVFSWAFFSEKGPRAVNEDATAVWSLGDDWLGAAVADGLGGHAGGQRASSLALEVLGRAIHEIPILNLSSVAKDIHARIRAEQEQAPEFQLMATTLSAIVLCGNEGRIVHCGDSQVALSRGRGIVRLTEAHTEARRLLKEGLITRHEYSAYPRKNVLDSALGVRGEPRIDTRIVRIRKGDRFFLTTDGTHNAIALRELKTLSENIWTAKELVAGVREIVTRRKPPDNYSFIAIYVD